jgi:superoxide dismutase, Fe-Mn family
MKKTAHFKKMYILEVIFFDIIHTMLHIRPALAYALTDLEPFISQETLQFHSEKHHQTYLDNLNTLIKDTEFENADLETLLHTTTGSVFNNAAQVWNHTFYFENLGKAGTTNPSQDLEENIGAIWWNITHFKDAFNKIALGTFGSGWAWLVIDESGSLKIRSTSNAQTPLTQGDFPLLTCDVWEHAYYIDTRNSRAKYLENFWQVVNWETVNQRFETYIETTERISETE